jgi:hypothetical protein
MMKHVKSERLKKLESELGDLEQWLKLGLVPKKDIVKHKEEIVQIRQKIEEEKERLQFLRESGDIEEYTTPKKAQNRSFTDMPSIPDIDMGESIGGAESQFDTESSIGFESTASDRDEDAEEEGEEDGEEEEEEKEDEDEESYFSDRNRWRRGGIIDPDADEW